MTVAKSAVQDLGHALAYRDAQLQLIGVSKNQCRSQNNKGDNGTEAFVQQSTLEANEALLSSATVLEAPGSPGAIAAAFSTIDAPDTVVLEAETKTLQRHHIESERWAIVSLRCA